MRVRLADGTVLSLQGRDAWALSELIRAGNQGCTPIDEPGPRWSAYVLKLRKAGISIETVYERHGGQFPGKHGRYILRSDLAVVSAEAAHA